MDLRKWLSGASGTAPTAPGSPSSGYPTGGTPGVTPPTNPGAFWFHQIGEELRAVLVAGSITPSTGTLTQLLSALQALYGTGTTSHSTLGALTVGAAGDAVGTIGSSGWEKRASGIHRQWATIQCEDNGGVSAMATWTLPNATLFATGIIGFRHSNLALLAGQVGGGPSSAPHPESGSLSLVTASATVVTLSGVGTDTTNTKFWSFVEVEGY